MVIFKRKMRFFGPIGERETWKALSNFELKKLFPEHSLSESVIVLVDGTVI